ncbi:MAG: hypothetical protein HY228_02335 [Candidatus Yonathbacteria bacterium]|nr:hypothetical protein [Candidatus Yonathbacteria bacterium]
MNNEELLIKNLLISLGVEDADHQVQEETVAIFTETLLKKMLVRIPDILSPEKRDEFLAIQETGNEVAVVDFLRENIPDFEKMMEEIREEALAEFRNIAEELTK